MMNSAIICENLVKSFDGTAVIHDVSFEIEHGEIVALLGPSGCGKTTLLRLIAGFEQLDGGRIVINGVEVASGTYFVQPEKRRVGMVFQDYAIFPHMSVRDNIKFGLRRRDTKRVDMVLEMVGLGGRGETMPHELSGGQQQRVALARAIAPQPDILLFDEPFSNLDASLREEIRSEVRALLRTADTTAIFVTHDQEEAIFLGDRVGVVHAGKLEQMDAAESIYHRPNTKFIAQFMGHSDFLPGVVTADGIDTPIGHLNQPIGLPQGNAVELMIRPDDIALVPDETASGRVIYRQFTGLDQEYRVRLADGTILQSRESHARVLPPLAAVRVEFDLDHDLPVFQGDKRIA